MSVMVFQESVKSITVVRHGSLTVRSKVVEAVTPQSINSAVTVQVVTVQPPYVLRKSAGVGKSKVIEPCPALSWTMNGALLGLMVKRYVPHALSQASKVASELVAPILIYWAASPIVIVRSATSEPNDMTDESQSVLTVRSKVTV